MAKGSCLCGKLTYEFTGEPVKTVLCHCLQCRKLTSSAFTTNLLVPSSAVTITGEPKHYDFVQETGDKFKTSFCGECSTLICKETDADGFQGLLILEAGSLDGGFEEFKPAAEIFVKHRTAWLGELNGLAQFQEKP
ncbi:hypothetical protein K432DRAFT_386903 [Lepidopterella palustris CBS 459.81]|uniref:CENP-V/GFA domain-containing protein n=1 Tax=Lepidopterella palustris CBS 459.81 TaxID=1314670 RepID=A0A8E2DYU2_9PEZI|nr:hypothetical protein K432DRAFT_386903 [Lepidopterella palustris CBS 459.81]